MTEYLSKGYNSEFVLMEGLNPHYLDQTQAGLISLFRSGRKGTEINGIEITYMSAYMDILRPDLEDYGISRRSAKEYVSLLNDLSKIGYFIDPERDFDYEKFNNLSLSLMNKMLKDVHNKKAQFLGQVIQSNLNLAHWIKERPLFTKGTFDRLEVLNHNALRDKYLFENLLWLIGHQQSNKKIIVSTSTLHMSKGISEIRTMADYLPDSIRKKSYFLPFISYHGERGINTEYKEFPIRTFLRDRNTVEFLFHSLKVEYGFLDFGKLNNKQRDYINKLKMYPSELLKNDAQWDSIYDGLFFIDNMEPVRWDPVSPRKNGYIKSILDKRTK